MIAAEARSKSFTSAESNGGYKLFRQRVLSRLCNVADRSNWFKAVQMDTTLGPCGVLVAAVVMDRADGGGVCWASQSYLARSCQLSLRSVRDAFKRLVEQKWLEVIQGEVRVAHLVWRDQVGKVSPQVNVYRMACCDEATFLLRPKREFDA